MTAGLTLSPQSQPKSRRTLSAMGFLLFSTANRPTFRVLSALSALSRQPLLPTKGSTQTRPVALNNLPTISQQHITHRKPYQALTKEGCNPQAEGLRSDDVTDVTCH